MISLQQSATHPGGLVKPHGLLKKPFYPIFLDNHLLINLSLLKYAIYIDIQTHFSWIIFALRLDFALRLETYVWAIPVGTALLVHSSEAVGVRRSPKTTTSSDDIPST